MHGPLNADGGIVKIWTFAQTAKPPRTKTNCNTRPLSKGAALIHVSRSPGYGHVAAGGGSDCPKKYNFASKEKPMYIARTKRKENIAEYILYLWQLEDLLRALQFSPEAIYSQLVAPAGEEDPESSSALLLWYIELGNLLRQEGKAESGHLDHTLHIVGELQQLHDNLLKAPAGERYRELWAAVSPEIPRLRAMLGKDDISSVEIMFRALYAVMLYRIKGDKTKESSISDVIELVSPLVGELARIFHLAEHGELDIWDEKTR